jgi:hypothetical protein
MLFYKLEFDYDEQKKQECLDKFVEIDSALSTVNSEHLIQAQRIVRRILSGSDPRDIIPRHGPGATACRTKNHAKWHGFRFISRLDKFYPYADYFFFNYSHLVDELDKLTNAEEVDPHARVVLVPKDSRGPRIISCEPREFQYIQQGQMRQLVTACETSPLSSGFVNFANQEINRELARLGSIDGSLSTIDLSEASDRVSLDLVEKLFPPTWVEALKASRSAATDLPDGTSVVLKKFAPMGSAVCFPVEALCFFSLLKSHLCGNVWVYGDDIIVNTEEFSSACDRLEAFGLKVNRDKSLSTGFFRESCGGEYWHGVDVGYVKLRKMITSSNYLSLIDFSNLITREFGLGIGTSIIKFFEEELRCYVPRQKLENGEVPGVFYTPHTSANDVFLKRRWNNQLQRFEYRIRRPLASSKCYRSLSEYHWCELFRKAATMDRYSRVGSYALPLRTIRYGWYPLRG